MAQGKAKPDSHSSRLLLALFSGGDERVFLEPATGRTKYGTPRRCAEDEIWLSSSTASALSPRGYAAAAASWHKLISGTETLESCCDDIRQRLTQLFGIPGTQAILTGSGTEAVLVSIVLARMLCGPRISTIIVGCAETGRGVGPAAAGLHFVRQAAFAEVVSGTPLEGLEDADLRVDTVAIRDAAGVLRSSAEIDAELIAKVEAARQDGRDVLIHRLDVSKTGQSAPSLDVLQHIRGNAPDHVFVLADCCQLRCAPAHIQMLLARGYLVSLTGSKFAGGPSFAGALLVPPAILQQLRPQPLPRGLATYSAQSDWPAILRDTLPLADLPAANIGLALRWQAALAEIDRFLAWPAALRTAILMRFHDEVAQRAGLTPGFEMLTPAPASETVWGHSILSIAMRHPGGDLFDMEAAATVQRRLRETGPRLATRRFHVGQPVAIGTAGVLRVCASAVLVNALAEDISAGVSLAEAFAPLAEDIAELFGAWSAITWPEDAQ
jgi:hypothetical protein